MKRELDSTDVPCRQGGELHRHVAGKDYYGDCLMVIIAHGTFIRCAQLARR